MPENAQESFKCQECGAMFPCENNKQKKCPVCGALCSAERCPRLGASNEGY